MDKKEFARLDCRGLSCPMPVINVKKALEQKNCHGVTVLVDSYASKENISRLVKTLGYKVEFAEVSKSEWEITVSKEK